MCIYNLFSLSIPDISFDPSSPTAIFIFVALGIVDSGVPHATIEPGRSFLDAGVAVTGASFRFARPTFTTTLGRTGTVGSAVGVSFPVPIKRSSVVDFKSYGGDSTLISTSPQDTKLNALSEKSSIDERYDQLDGSCSGDDIERQVKREISNTL